MRSEVESSVNGLLNNGINTLRANFVSYLQGLGSFLVNSVLSVVNTLTFLLGFFLIPFWLFYVLMDQRSGAQALNRMLPSWLREDFWALTAIVDFDVSGYVRGQIILGLSVGTAAGVGLLILQLFGLHVNYILLLAVIAAFTELIPVIGPILGAVPAVILGFIDSPTTGLAVLVLYTAIQQLENNFLVPRIVGDSVGLHPSILMVLLVVCSQVFGLPGAILSAPMGAIARDVFTYLYGRLSEPPLPAGQLPERISRPTAAIADPEPPQPPQFEPPPAERPAEGEGA
jgi:predicted PurR-regulated permease PerM